MKAVIRCTLLAVSLVALASNAVAAERHCKDCKGGRKHAAKKVARGYAHYTHGPYGYRWYKSSGDKLRNYHCGQCVGVHYRPWHCNYYHTEWGAPVALVMPPTAELTTNMGWGVSNTRVTHICHQFARPYPGPGTGQADGRPLMPTPHWPSDTTQFGVYPVRAPFK